MSYIGKEPTPVPLSTADYQDGSVTAPKLATGAAVANIGYTPLNKAGDSVTGNFDVVGTTDLAATNVTGVFTQDGNFVQTSGTFTLFQDPAANLQAATKQYVDNNFQLATGAIQALNADLTLTAASARVFEFTSVTEYVRVNLPDATTLSISNGKFVFRNEGGNPFGVYDNAGNLIGAVGPQSTATCYLYSIATAAGKWSLVGDDVRPFFIANSNTAPGSGVATQDTLVSTNVAVTIKLTNTDYIIVCPDNTATNQQVIAYGVSTATTPATVGTRLVVTPLSTTAGAGNPLTAASLQNIVWAFRVDDTTAYVANASGVGAHAVLKLTSPAVVSVSASNLTGTAFATAPQTSTTLGEFSQIQRITDTLYLYMNATTAATFSYQAFRIDPSSSTIRVSAAVNSPNVTATGGSGMVDPRLVQFSGNTGTVAVCRATGTAANFGLLVEKTTITDNGAGAAPTVVVNSTVAVTTAAITTTNAFGFALDVSNTDYGVVCYYQAGTQMGFNGVSGLQGAGAITMGAQQLVTNGAAACVATGSQRFVGSAATAPVIPALGAGLISNSRTLWFDSYGDSAWRAMQVGAAFIRFVKITRGVGANWSSTFGETAIPDGTASLFSLFPISTYSSRFPTTSAVTADPTFAIVSNATMTPAAGPQGGTKIYVVTDIGSNKINFKGIVAPDNFSIRDNTTTGGANIGVYPPFQSLMTRSGYFVFPIGSPTATTTNQLSFNTFAFFKMDSNGSMRYYGKWQLPFKAVNEVFFNTVWGVQDNEVNISGNAVEYNAGPGQGNHFIRFAKIDFAVVS